MFLPQQFTMASWQWLEGHRLSLCNSEQFGNREIGRPENVIGSHSGSAGNSNGIGVCVAGNFMNSKPTEEQFQACVELVRDIYSRYGALVIQGHRDVMATACPGAMFPLEEIKRTVADNSALFPPVNILVNGQVIQSILVKGQTMAPIRQVLDILRVPFSWDAKSQFGSNWLLQIARNDH